MNQVPSHSQTPDFGHIPPTGILYQQPPSTEQLAKSNKRAKSKTRLKDIIAAVMVIGTIVSAPFVVKSCSEEADRQAVEAVKFQMEVGK